MTSRPLLSLPRAPRRAAFAVVVPLMTLLAGCSSGSSGSGSGSGPSDASSCGFMTPPPPMYQPDGGAAGDASASAMAQEAAEQSGLSTLDEYVGQYLRGEALIYQGTISAHDNQGLGLPPPSPGQAGFTDQTIPEQPAFATLTTGGQVLVNGQVMSGAMQLTDHGTTSHQYVGFFQSKSEPNVTTVSIILGDNAYGGDQAQCTSCAPDLSTLPTSIDLKAFKGTAIVPVSDSSGVSHNFTLEVDATTSLTALAPCALTFAELAEANGSVEGPKFAKQGDKMVATLSGTINSPPYSRGMCGGTAYTIDIYVSLSNLADYGVQNFKLGATGVICPG